MDDIQWYPGHMARAMRFVRENIKNVDVIMTITDARAPLASLNNELYELSKIKPFVIVINKCDLVDKKHIDRWLDYFSANNIFAVPFSVKRPKLDTVFNVLSKAGANKKKSHAELKVMITGITNAGKSSFINILTRRAKLKTGKKAGLTRGIQWVNLDKYAFLDTPGIVMKKLENHQGMMLAAVGSIKDEILDMETIGRYFIDNFIDIEHNEKICSEFNIESLTLENIAHRRGFLNSSGCDVNKAGNALIKMYREGKLGRIMLEHPPETEE